MRKHILVLFLLCSLFVFGARAQFSAGLLGGATFAQVDGDKISGYNKTGLSAGIRIDYKINERWYSGFEILYTMKGSKEITDPDKPVADLFRLRFDYIEFPLKLSYEKKDFLFYFGPTVGVNVIAMRDELGLGWMDTEIRKMEFGALAGAEYDLSDQFSIGLRHQNSLVRVGDDYDNGLNIWNRAGLYNRLFGIYVVYVLGK